jgi:two-component system, NarL family, response regulator DevR
MSQKTRVLLVDDHEMVRVGLRTLIEQSPDCEVMGEVQSLHDARTFLSSQQPDVVLLDIRLPDGSGFELCHYLQTFTNPPKVLVLTSYSERDVILKALSAGADGYLLKDIDSKGLLEAIRNVITGQSILDPAITRTVLNAFHHREADRPGRSNSLSPQEMRVLALVAEGKTNRQIGEALQLSEKTVKNYFSNILEKLELSRRSQAAAYYVENFR